jgi:Rieske Fe-S protein
MDRLPRRSFLRLLGAAAGLIALTPLQSAFARAKKQSGPVSVGRLEDFTVGAPVIVKNVARTPVIVYRREGGVTVLSAKCTHQGCPVRVDEGGTYSCGCHGSQFKYDGTVTKGPAARRLDAIPFEISAAGEILVADA